MFRVKDSSREDRAGRAAGLGWEDGQTWTGVARRASETKETPGDAASKRQKECCCLRATGAGANRGEETGGRFRESRDFGS